MLRSPIKHRSKVSLEQAKKAVFQNWIVKEKFVFESKIELPSKTNF